MNQISKALSAQEPILENIPIALCLIDLKGDFAFINQPFVKMFGYEYKEISCLSDWLDYCLMNKTERTEFDKILQTRIKAHIKNKEEIYLGQFEFMSKRKTVKSVEINISSINNNILLLFKDFSKYKKVEKEIIREKDFTENLINSFPGIFYLFNLGGDNVAQLVRWNKNIETYTGYPPNELIYKPVHEFFDKSESEKITDAIDRIIKENEVLIEANLKLKNGTTRPYEFKGKLFIDAGTQYFFGMGSDISSRKEAELLIKNSEIRYKFLSNLSFEGILIHQNGIAIDMNDAFARMFGYQTDELLGRNLIELLGDTEDRELMYHHIKINYPHPYEVNAYKKTGEQFPAELLGREIMHNGKKTRVVSVRDLSERKDRENELTEHQLFIQKITEQSPDIIYIYDIENAKNIYINKDLRQVLGYSESELSDSSTEIIQKLIHPDDVEQFSDFYKKTHKVEKDFVFEFIYRLKTKSGNWRWFAGKEKEFQQRHGHTITMIGTLQDITTQKQYERALLESEEQLSTIFENAPMIMVLITEDRRILKMNKIARKRIGKHYVDALNQLFGDAFTCINSSDIDNCGKSEACDNCQLRKTVSNTFDMMKNHYKVETILKIREGNVFKENFVLLSTTLMKRMTPTTVLITIDDITDRKLMEIDLQKAKEKAEESNKLKTAFLQNMSHEIRTPMNGIIGFSEMLNKPDISEDRRKLYTDIIVKSSQQLLVVVNDILDISKIETGIVETVEEVTNINLLLSELFSFYKPQAWKKGIGIHINLPLENGRSVILVDDIKLRQILNNLLSNAMKFTHEGYIKIGYQLEQGNLLFYVEDTGIGIEEAYYEKIFEQFRQIELTSTRKYGGTGLGLSICRAYAKVIGGKLWLSSIKHKGSTFYLTIPYKHINAEPLPNSQGQEINNKPFILGNPTILIAEDEEVNFLFLKEIINELQIKILHAKDGEEAINLVKTEKISLALLDIKMPNVNGYTAVEAIKKLKPVLPVVAQTAFATQDDQEKALKAGFDDYLPKPIQKEKLYVILKKYLNFRVENPL